MNQLSLACPCGRARVFARGQCSTCYTLHRQDELYFGGLREHVLRRDGYRCRVCDAPGNLALRTIVVHHRKPGISTMPLMISLCPGDHARVHRTIVMVALWPPLLKRLWREIHPRGSEQFALDLTHTLDIEPVAQLALPPPLTLELHP